MSQDDPTAPEGVRQAAPAHGQRGAVESFTSVAEAALALGHRTYSGTIATTDRLP